MSSINKLHMIGRIGQQPEIKALQSGNKVASFSLATSEKYTNKNGEKVENTDWHSCEVWGKLADVVEKYVNKGDLIYIEGQLKYDKWEDQQGNKREKAKIRCTSMTMLGGNKESNKPVNEPTQQQSPPDQEPDLPF